jgi:hypothetical protein
LAQLVCLNAYQDYPNVPCESCDDVRHLKISQPTEANELADFMKKKDDPNKESL